MAQWLTLPAPKHSLECLTVVDDCDHVLHVAVRVLPIPQVLLLVQLSLFPISEDTQSQVSRTLGTMLTHIPSD